MAKYAISATFSVSAGTTTDLVGFTINTIEYGYVDGVWVVE